MNQDGSMNVTYAIGTGTEDDGVITEFNPLVTEYKYLDGQQAMEIMMKPMTKDDIGKQANQLVYRQPITIRLSAKMLPIKMLSISCGN